MTDPGKEQAPRQLPLHLAHRATPGRPPSARRNARLGAFVLGLIAGAVLLLVVLVLAMALR